MTSRTDAELLQASRAGHREAFGELVVRYQRMVEAAALSAGGCRDAVDDVVQDTFVSAWRTLDRLRDDAALRSWLFGIARNLARKARRAQRPTEEIAAETSVSTETPFDTVASREIERDVAAALARLPQRYREPLVLFYYEHCSVKEVATALDMQEDAAMQRLSRGRRKLGEELAARVETILESRASRVALVAGVLALLPARSAAAATVTSATGGAGIAALAGASAARLRALGALLTSQWRIIGGVLGTASAVAVVVAASVNSEAVAAKAAMRAPEPPSLPEPDPAAPPPSVEDDPLSLPSCFALPPQVATHVANDPSLLVTNMSVASDDPVESCTRVARGLIYHWFGESAYRIDGDKTFFEPCDELRELAEEAGRRAGATCDIGDWPELYVRCEATLEEALAGNVTCFPYDHFYDDDRHTIWEQ